VIEFRQTQHAIRNAPIIEVWMDGKFRAAIYPNDAGISIISNHLQGEPVNNSLGLLHSWQFNFSTEEPAQTSASVWEIKEGALGRWIIVNASSPNLAWSGSRWVLHQDGIPTGEAQVCNFATPEEAQAYAAEHFSQFFPPPIM
jgi:hypothetical protein